MISILLGFVTPFVILGLATVFILALRRFLTKDDPKPKDFDYTPVDAGSMVINGTLYVMDLDTWTAIKDQIEAQTPRLYRLTETYRNLDWAGPKSETVWRKQKMDMTFQITAVSTIYGPFQGLLCTSKKKV